MSKCITCISGAIGISQLPVSLSFSLFVIPAAVWGFSVYVFDTTLRNDSQKPHEDDTKRVIITN